jgi:tetratricopeptide (TPR) repeat protein
LSIGINLTALASVRRQRGDLQGAAELFHESLTIGRQVVPPDHPGLAYPLLDLGNVLLELGNVTAAELLLREAHTLRQRSLPAESPLIAESAAALGKCLIERRDFAAAEQILLMSYRSLQQVEHSEPGPLAQVCEQLVNLYEHWGQEPKAVLYRQPQSQGR